MYIKNINRNGKNKKGKFLYTSSTINLREISEKIIVKKPKIKILIL